MVVRGVGFGGGGDFFSGISAGKEGRGIWMVVCDGHFGSRGKGGGRAACLGLSTGGEEISVVVATGSGQSKEWMTEETGVPVTNEAGVAGEGGAGGGAQGAFFLASKSNGLG